MRPLADELQFLLPPCRGSQVIPASAWGPASAAETSSSGALELAGSVVQHRHEGQRDDGSVFGVLNVFQRDRDSEDILLYAFDSLGFPPDPPARGRWHGADLVFLRTSPRGSARTVFSPTPAGYRWSKQFRPSEDQAWQDVFSDELRRLGD